MFEIDADVVGADFFVRFTALETWQQLSRPMRQRLCSLCLLAAGLTFLLLDRQQRKLAPSRGVHQSPFVRFLIVLDILGGAFHRELNLNDVQLRRAARTAVGWLGRAAQKLGWKASVWNVADRRAWRQALDRQARLLQRHERGMLKLLGRQRSTFLPSEAGAGGLESPDSTPSKTRYMRKTDADLCRVNREVCTCP